MAGSGWTAPGVNHVPEYLVSGAPWVTGSLAVGSGGAQRISFPNVTRFFLVRNTGANPCRVGFTESGTEGDNFFSVNSGSTQQFDLRVRDVFIQGDGGATTIDLMGGLTAIPRRNYSPLTGANPPPEGAWYLPGIE